MKNILSKIIIISLCILFFSINLSTNSHYFAKIKMQTEAQAIAPAVAIIIGPLWSAYRVWKVGKHIKKAHKKLKNQCRRTYSIYKKNGVGGSSKQNEEGCHNHCGTGEQQCFQKQLRKFSGIATRIKAELGGRVAFHAACIRSGILGLKPDSGHRRRVSSLRKRFNACVREIAKGQQHMNYQGGKQRPGFSSGAK